MKQLMIEHQKAKGRHIFLTLFLFLGLLLLWNGITFNAKNISQGWIGQLYNMTLMNAVICPTFAAVIASRIIDAEHKGNTWKLLEVLQSKKTIFYGKVFYGSFYIFLFVLLETTGLIGTGLFLHFQDSFTPWAYGLFLVNNFTICLILFLIQMILSLCFMNQAVSLCIGICGSMAGLFLLFIPGNLLHLLLPWGEFSAINFVYMDWNKATRSITYYYEFQHNGIFFILITWLLLLLFGGYYLFTRMDTDGFQLSVQMPYKKHTSKVNKFTKLHLSPFPTELMKIKRTPIWIAFLILPVISAIIGTFNYKMNIDILKLGWYDMWSQHSLFFCFFFFAPLIGVYASYLWRLEHNGTNWNLILCLMAPWRIVLHKVLVCQVISTLTILWLTLLYIIGGISAGLPISELPKELPLWILCGILGSSGICTAQCFLSLIFRSFSIPIGLSLVGSILGLLCSAKGKYYLLPYSNFSIGMRANNPKMELPIASFVCSLIFFIILFYGLSVIYLIHADAKTNA